MYYCDNGIVLRHRDLNEADRIVTIFTRSYGRIEANFKGVKKSTAKLRALTELFCHCDYRFYLRKYGSIPLCIGGSEIYCYANLRSNLESIMLANFLADVVMSLTPVYQRSEEKFNLLLSSFDYLDKTNKISKWFVVWFMANMLEYYGVGFKETNIGYESKFWKRIHTPVFIDEKMDEYDDIYLDVFNFMLSKINEHAEKKLVFNVKLEADYVFSKHYK
ncbi:MAG: DNA repair protein RecO [Elusimicrobiota bacterium]